MTESAAPREARVARRMELEGEGLRLDAEARRLGVIRFVVFFVALAPWVVAELSSAVPEVVGFGSLPLLAVFALLVARHRRLRARRKRVGVAEELARQAVARIDREWGALPDPQAAPARAGGTHPWAVDLDLYGPASLRQLLGPVHTPMGAATLDGWLLDPVVESGLTERQEAVRELAADDVLREEVSVEGALLDPVDPTALDGFMEWCVEPPVVSVAAARAAWVLPILTLLFAVGDGLDRAPGWSWLLPLAASAVVAFRWGHRLHLEFAKASSGVPGLRRYHRLFALWEASPGQTPLRRQLVGALGTDDRAASAALRRLERLLDMADARFSSLHPVFSIGLLWDVHIGHALDRWRAAHGAHVADWMAALGSLEAISSVATLAADHPRWTMPTLEPVAAQPRFTATALGHPLLHPEVAVANDVELGPPGRVLLITGSNMSGKSTLLRSIGLATVMTGLGAPVCADALHLTRCRFHTSMRVQDSLEAGVSFFMAELRRLAAILEVAPAAGSTEVPLLYLVDEILQGTNSEERRVAGRRFVRHLLRRRAIGAVTTHDLGFHEHPEVEAAADLVHFRESVAGGRGGEGPGLTFDYRLRTGLATTRNALRLAEQVGLTDPDADPTSESSG